MCIWRKLLLPDFSFITVTDIDFSEEQILTNTWREMAINSRPTFWRFIQILDSIFWING